jgi:hypothetical protein
MGSPGRTIRRRATGLLKPRGGPKITFDVQSLVADREFVDVSKLCGARLIFVHQVTVADGGGCEVEVPMTMDGPLRWLWNRGRGLRSSVQITCGDWLSSPSDSGESPEFLALRESDPRGVDPGAAYALPASRCWQHFRSRERSSRLLASFRWSSR